MSLEQKISQLATSIGADIKALRSADGGLTALSTTAKTSLVAAINELFTMIGSIDTSSVIDDAAASATKTYSSNKITADIAAAVAALVDGSPAALDTLNEFAAALANNPNYATDIAASLGNRVRVDAAQTLTPTQQTQARDNIDAASLTAFNALLLAIGDVDADFVADYEAARDAP